MSTPIRPPDDHDMLVQIWEKLYGTAPQPALTEDYLCGYNDGCNDATENNACKAESLAPASQPQVSEAQRLLESLTPGGSEFAGDAKACAAYVLKKISSVQNIAKNAIKRAAQPQVSEEQVQGLHIQNSEDGIWLCFTDSSKGQAALNLDKYAEERGLVEKWRKEREAYADCESEVIKNWCNDTRALLSAPVLEQERGRSDGK